MDLDYQADYLLGPEPSPLVADPLGLQLYGDTGQPLIEVALAALKARLPYVANCRDYYAGRHPVCFAGEAWRETFAALFRQFADNLCPSVVGAVADRLEVIGFHLDDRQVLPRGEVKYSELAEGLLGGGYPPSQAEPAPTPEESTRLGALAWDIWTDNGLEAMSDWVHEEALQCGDAYVIVWPSRVTGLPVFYPQHAGQVVVGYDDEELGLVRWAAKAWVTGDRRLRLNLYLPDRIEKWVTVNRLPGSGAPTTGELPEKSSAFQPYVQVNGDGPEPWPLPNPYGEVPVFHFATGAGPGGLGTSELDVMIPLQDMLNKSVLDMAVAMEFAAFPQRWATGLEAGWEDEPGMPPGAPSRFVAGMDRLWAVAETEAKFGQFAATDLKQYIGVQDSVRLEVARVTGTPLHYLMVLEGVPPSGEALRTIEGRRIAKVKKRQRRYGMTWARAMGLAMRTLGVEGVRLQTAWRSAEDVGGKEQVDTLFTKQQLGVPRAQCLSELDYPEGKVEQMLTDWDAEREQDAKLEIAKQQAKAVARPTAQSGGPQRPQGPQTSDGGKRGDGGSNRRAK